MYYKLYYRMGIMQAVKLCLSPRLNARAGRCYWLIPHIEAPNGCPVIVQPEPAQPQPKQRTGHPRQPEYRQNSHQPTLANGVVWQVKNPIWNVLMQDLINI